MPASVRPSPGVSPVTQLTTADGHSTIYPTNPTTSRGTLCQLNETLPTGGRLECPPPPRCLTTSAHRVHLPALALSTHLWRSGGSHAPNAGEPHLSTPPHSLPTRACVVETDTEAVTDPMSNWPKPSPRFAEYVRKMSACGHWTFTGRTGTDKAVLEHDGVTVAYQLHDGGNDWNGPRNFAAEAQRACGCKFIESRGRKKSRKAFRPSGFSVEGTYSNSTQRRVDHLVNKWHRVDARFAEIEALGEAAPRDLISEARDLIADRSAIERELAELHQPTPVRSN